MNGHMNASFTVLSDSFADPRPYFILSNSNIKYEKMN